MGQVVDVPVVCYDKEKDSQNTTTVKYRCRQLLETGTFSDVTIAIEKDGNQKTFRVHKAVLASASEVFANLFHEHNTSDNIIIRNVDPVGFEKMIRYIYLDDCEFETPEIAQSTLNVARQYMLDHLQDVCSFPAFGNITTDTACQILESTTDFGLKRIQMMALYFICKNTDKVIQCDSFLKCRIDTVLEITKQDCLNISEPEVIGATLKWAYSECQRMGKKSTWPNLRICIECLLPHIRFMSLTPEQFHQGPFENKLLTDSETLSFVMNYKQRGCRPFPKWYLQKEKRTILPDFATFPVPVRCQPSTANKSVDPNVIVSTFTARTGREKCVVVNEGKFSVGKSYNQEYQGTLSFRSIDGNYSGQWKVSAQSNGYTFGVTFPVPVIVFDGETCEISFRRTQNATEGKRDNIPNPKNVGPVINDPKEILYHSFLNLPLNEVASFKSLSCRFMSWQDEGNL